MPSYGSYIAAAQAVYDGLTAANFPGAARFPGPYLDEAPTTGTTGERIDPPFVVIRDLGADPQWTFTGKVTAGANALVVGEFVLEVYAQTLADCDTALAAVLWNGQVPNSRAGLAFATFTLTTPQKGIAGAVVPMKAQRSFAGVNRAGARVHVAKQWFKVKTAISGDGT